VPADRADAHHSDWPTYLQRHSLITYNISY